jgi:hypothetical protein
VFHLLASRLEKPSSVSVDMLFAVGVSLASPKCLFCVGGVKGVGGGGRQRRAFMQAAHGDAGLMEKVRRLLG